MEKQLPDFLYILYKAQSNSVIIFPFIPSHSSFVSNEKNYFINSLSRFVLKRNPANFGIKELINVDSI